MYELNSRYNLEIGFLGKCKFFTLFDKKLFCIVYQIKISNGVLEEYYPGHNIDNTKSRAKLTKNRVVPNCVKEHIISLAKKEFVEKRIFLVGCAANKKPGFSQAAELYKSTRITWAKKVAKKTKSDLYILSAKFGIVASYTILPNYDLKMDEHIANELFEKVKKQLILQNIKEVVFFKAGINKSYFELMNRVCKDLKINLIAKGTAIMGGSKEIEKILMVS